MKPNSANEEKTLREWCILFQRRCGEGRNRWFEARAVSGPIPRRFVQIIEHSISLAAQTPTVSAIPATLRPWFQIFDRLRDSHRRRETAGLFSDPASSVCLSRKWVGPHPNYHPITAWSDGDTVEFVGLAHGFFIFNWAMIPCRFCWAIFWAVLCRCCWAFNNLLGSFSSFNESHLRFSHWFE